MNKIEHIGIAVKSIDSSTSLFAKLFAKNAYKREEVLSEGVITEFFQLGDNKIELLEATHAESPIAKFIEKKGEGIHHIAFEVSDIVAEMKRLKEEGFILLSEEPKKGADNKLVCFLHPKSTTLLIILSKYFICSSRLILIILIVNSLYSPPLFSKLLCVFINSIILE